MVLNALIVAAIAGFGLGFVLLFAGIAAWVMPGGIGWNDWWGGIGTVIGSAIGAFTVSFIQTGVVGVGLSGFYVQFFYGLIIILSLLGHRWNQVRYR